MFNSEDFFKIYYNAASTKTLVHAAGFSLFQ